MSAELKPCPFCGETLCRTAHIRDGRQAYCTGCKASGPAKFHGPLDMPTADARAVAAWNSRAPSDALEAARARIAELEAANAKLADEVAFLKDPQGYPDLW